MLDIKDLHVNYGKSRVINGIDLTINEGEKLVIMGRNGVGKTTLLKSMMGVLTPESGTISFLDKDVTKLPAHSRSLMGMAYVPQGREIIPDYTVEENLDLGGYAHTKGLAGQKAKILDLFPALEEHMKRKGGVLSGGQQQQLAIGRALMSNPKMLILDEPTEGIQPNVVAEIAHILNRVRNEMGVTIVVVEQNYRFCRKVADRFIMMQKGKIVASGMKEDMSDDLVQKYLSV
ncbi:MAG: urea ABC transporter ATP-binding subunit UrtE [Oscillospiraceae bacterium]|nr:urea ABC transporter ATP-binding subunit UrtE [Oscillospiraceae bacterium]